MSTVTKIQSASDRHFTVDRAGHVDKEQLIVHMNIKMNG
jgi:hypothetical protein